MSDNETVCKSNKSLSDASFDIAHCSIRINVLICSIVMFYRNKRPDGKAFTTTTKVTADHMCFLLCRYGLIVPSFLFAFGQCTFGSCLTCWSYSDKHFGQSFHGVHSSCLSIEVYPPWLMVCSEVYGRLTFFKYYLGLSFGGAPLRSSQQHGQHFDDQFLM